MHHRDREHYSKNLLFVIEMALQHCSLCGSKKGQPQPTDTEQVVAAHGQKGTVSARIIKQEINASLEG